MGRSRSPSCQEGARVASETGAPHHMMIASSRGKAVAPAAAPDLSAMPGPFVFPLLTAAELGASLPDDTQAQERPAAPMEARIKALIPELAQFV